MHRPAWPHLYAQQAHDWSPKRMSPRHFHRPADVLGDVSVCLSTTHWGELLGICVPRPRTRDLREWLHGDAYNWASRQLCLAAEDRDSQVIDILNVRQGHRNTGQRAPNLSLAHGVRTQLWLGDRGIHLARRRAAGGARRHMARPHQRTDNVPRAGFRLISTVRAATILLLRGGPGFRHA